MVKSKPNPKVDPIFRSAKWKPEMEKLRAILLACSLTEELKWSQPCYTFEGKNVVVMGDFKNYCVLIVAKGALLKDPKKILIQPSENTQAMRQIRFTSLAEVEALKPALKSFMAEAIEIAKSGRDVVYKKTSEFAVPAELTAKFKVDAELKKAFAALTPGRQRAYLLHFAAAKQSETRTARIEKYREKILRGEGYQDDYLKKKGRS